MVLLDVNSHEKDDNTKYRGWEFLDKIKKDDIILCHIGTHHIVAVKNKKDLGYLGLLL